MQPKAGSGDNKASRQCWECHKRRLVCDHTLPHCKKCQKAGRECPGYDEQKPLQWVETGKVHSKQRKKDTPPKMYVVACMARKEPSPEEPQGHMLSRTASSSNNLVGEEFEFQANPTAWESEDEGAWQLHSNKSLEEQGFMEEMIKCIKIVEQIGKMSQQGGRKRIERVVRNRLCEEASEIMRNEEKPLEKLENLLCHMHIYDLPVYDYLTNETSDVVQAVDYFNVRLLPEVKATEILAPNPAIMMVPLQILYLLSPAIHHTFTCMALNHFVITAPTGVDKAIVAMNRSKLYRHRGHAIRALGEDISREKTRSSDMTIVGILIFMSMELSNPTFTDWRMHAKGIQRLIDMRGGLSKLIVGEPQLITSLVMYLIIVTYANTCSPPWEQLVIDTSGSIETYISDITPIYGLIFPYILCPPTLFFDLVRINHLRNLASASLLLGIEDSTSFFEAHHIIARIEAFLPEDWAQPGPQYDEWILIGTIYKSALAIYCTMSLQSLAVLPKTPEMDAIRSIHGDCLRNSLAAALKSKSLSRYLMWPLVVAGVEAGCRRENVRNWVAQQLTSLSRQLGSSSPIKASEVLARYWKKGKLDWDACFDRAYGFVI